ncbi:MAG: biopolymer transporter ExbD [Acidobacteria bacterium]|nr:biopolymer transporter ExbD [Acidobacteriota bacterium]
MKKLANVCAACLVTITAILVHRTYSEHRQSRKSEAAMALMEANKPHRFRPEISPTDTRTPNSLHQLIVSVDDGGVLRLNSQDAGTVGDVSHLRMQLEQALKERGEGRPDRAIIVKASPRLKYVEVKKVIDVVKAAGATPVELQTYDPE